MPKNPPNERFIKTKLPDFDILCPPQLSAFVEPNDPILFLKSAAIHKLENYIQKSSPTLEPYNGQTEETPLYESTTEPFIPGRKPLSKSDMNKQKKKRDMMWFTEYFIEFTLIVLGFSAAYMLFYYVNESPTIIPEELRTRTFLDKFIMHLAYPAEIIRSLLSSNGLPTFVSDIIKKYPSIVILCTALFTTVSLLWSKTHMLQSVKDATMLKASSFVHGLIAWSYLTTSFAFTFENGFMLSWILNFPGTLISLIAIAVICHCTAGISQLGVFAAILYLFGGIEKYITTGKYLVNIPIPYQSEGTCGPGEYCSVENLRPLPSKLDKLNEYAYTILRYIREIVFILFGIVKTVNSKMQTSEGVFSVYAVNGMLILGSITSMFVSGISSTPLPSTTHVVMIQPMR